MAHPGGRPTALTPQVLEDVRRLLPTCLYIETVADFISLDRSTVRKWLKRGAKEHQRLSRNKRAKARQAEALYMEALKDRRGHCSDYHGLCAAIGRALNYPTRVTYGINTFAKNSPSHCKLEAFLPPYGWVCFDVSETQNLVSRIEKDSQLSDKEKAEL